jgi:uncharacterized protein with GYD domain
MATFITLINFTDMGITNFKDTVARAKVFEGEASGVGIKVLQTWWTIGGFDGVVLFEAADTQTATAALLTLSSHGFVRTKTLQALTGDQMDKILGDAS